jgi:hypothetical protein
MDISLQIEKIWLVRVAEVGKFGMGLAHEEGVAVHTVVYVAQSVILGMSALQMSPRMEIGWQYGLGRAAGFDLQMAVQ